MKNLEKLLALKIIIFDHFYIFVNQNFQDILNSLSKNLIDLPNGLLKQNLL